MKKLLLAAALALAPLPALADCTGVFPASTVCGNLSGSPQPPAPFSTGGSIFGPSSSTSGDLAIFSNSSGSGITDAGSLTGAVITSSYIFSGGLTIQGFNNFTGQTSLTTANITSGFFYKGTLINLGFLPYLNTTNNFTGFNNFSGATSMTGAVSMSAPVIAGQGPITIPVSTSFGGTGLSAANVTSHTIPIFEGTAPMSNTTAGALGQCVVFNGPGVDPTPASGCWRLLTTMQSPTTGYSTSTAMSGYVDYMLSIQDLVPIATTPFCAIQEYIVSQFIASNYITAASGAYAPTTSIPCSNSNNVGPSPGITGECTIHTNGDNTNYKTWTCFTQNLYAGTWEINNSGGYFSFSTSQATGVQVGFTTNGVSSGIVKIYGRQ